MAYFNMAVSSVKYGRSTTSAVLQESVNKERDAFGM